MYCASKLLFYCMLLYVIFYHHVSVNTPTINSDTVKNPVMLQTDINLLKSMKLLLPKILLTGGGGRWGYLQYSHVNVYLY